MHIAVLVIPKTRLPAGMMPFVGSIKKPQLPIVAFNCAVKDAVVAFWTHPKKGFVVAHCASRSVNAIDEGPVMKRNISFSPSWAPAQPLLQASTSTPSISKHFVGICACSAPPQGKAMLVATSQRGIGVLNCTTSRRRKVGKGSPTVGQRSVVLGPIGQRCLFLPVLLGLLLRHAVSNPSPTLQRMLLCPSAVSYTLYAVFCRLRLRNGPRSGSVGANRSPYLPP